MREHGDEDDEDEIVEEFEPADPVLGIFFRLDGFHCGTFVIDGAYSA